MFDEGEPVFVSMEVKRIRRYLDEDAVDIPYGEVRREIHRLLDRVCEAADNTYSEWEKKYLKQGEVMAETARRNVIAENRIKELEASK